MRRLRVLKQPITFFAEEDIDRLKRLLKAEEEFDVGDEHMGGQQGNILLELEKERKKEAEAKRAQKDMDKKSKEEEEQEAMMDMFKKAAERLEAMPMARETLVACFLSLQASADSLVCRCRSLLTSRTDGKRRQ